MILDTSVLIALIKREPERIVFTQSIKKAQAPRISAASYLEAAIVVDGNRDPVMSRKLDQMLSRASISIEPVTELQVRIARQAYRDFGKGSGHPAQLNFGDCFAYALAKDKGEPLLVKGEDFSKTDVAVA